MQQNDSLADGYTDQRLAEPIRHTAARITLSTRGDQSGA